MSKARQRLTKRIWLDAIFIHGKKSFSGQEGGCLELEPRRGVIMALIQARMSSRGINTALKQRGINNEMMRHGPSEDDAQGGEAENQRCGQAKI